EGITEDIVKFAHSLEFSSDSIDALSDLMIDALNLPFSNISLVRTGHWVTFDGPSGTGKDTQIELLLSYLALVHYNLKVDYLTQKRGHPGLKEVDPIRKVLKSYWKEQGECQNQRTTLLLLSASRKYYVQQVLLPSLTQNELVICNRSQLSDFAYQPVLPFGELREMCYFDIEWTPEDLGILMLYNDQSVAHDRITKRAPLKGGVIYPNESPDFIARVSKNYGNLVEHEYPYIQIVDANPEMYQVHREIIDRVEELI
ncbi:thymidylate kinase, partial [Candidatus Woesearchaeota archaeon]|nr:thymidylate kinase [Candidatus Woesearchaeota archaeon]